MDTVLAADDRTLIDDRGLTTVPALPLAKTPSLPPLIRDQYYYW
ncbi:hypothetical protein GbCGDNIH6_8253 [Granulibacter bethesdensis]|nr:hypothetical protein GbCGDNIH6_8253 [Granulibacter bethesdensis]